MDLDAASVLFASDRIIDGSHTLLPHLEAFRCILGQSTIYRAITYFLRKREKLRRLDLGSCPWDVVRFILPDLANLRVLAVQIDHPFEEVIESFIESIPREMVAISISVKVSDKPLVRTLPNPRV